MSGNTVIKGSRIGAGPLGETERGELAPRVRISYWCAGGHESTPNFAADDEVELPEEWDCAKCGLKAGLDPMNPPAPETTEVFKTHLAYVKERRSAEDGEELLKEALGNLRSRRRGVK